MVAVSLVSLPAHAADDAEGIGISVPVLGPTPSPSSTAAAGGAAASGGGSTNGGASKGGSTGTSAGTAVTTDTAAPAPASDDMLIAGGLYLSDISGTSRPTMNPFEGTSELWVTLRNLSSDTIDATADFSLATAFGTRIDGAQVRISGLKPNESRVVATTLSGSGQWPFVVGRVTVSPPDQIAGQATSPVSRATVVYVFPWLLLIGLVLMVLALVILKLTASVAVAPAVVAPAAGAA